MKDLSLPLGTLVPSSQEGGNLVQGDLAEKTMTAPGSDPVSPLPDPRDQSDPQPNASVPVQDGPLGLGVLIPVADTKGRTLTAAAVPVPRAAWVPTPAGAENLRVPIPGSDWQGEMP